jgi:hypothetical protein
VRAAMWSMGWFQVRSLSPRRRHLAHGNLGLRASSCPMPLRPRSEDARRYAKKGHGTTMVASLLCGNSATDCMGMRARDYHLSTLLTMDVVSCLSI